jgi:hypothetical protein
MSQLSAEHLLMELGLTCLLDCLVGSLVSYNHKYNMFSINTIHFYKKNQLQLNGLEISKPRICILLNKNT